MLVDTHAHFDFLQGTRLRAEFLREIAARDVRIVAQMLTPSSFVRLLDDVDALKPLGVPLPLCSLGFHPWHIEADAVSTELALFEANLPRTRFIGEIGLDFSPRRLEEAPEALQREVFAGLLARLADGSKLVSDEAPFVLSIHTVRSASAVLDELDAIDLAQHHIVPVFHRFGGTSDELTRLIRMGGYLSVHPAMLATKRGRHYVQQVPAERLLLESDLPAEAQSETSAESASRELVTSLDGTLRTLTKIRGHDVATALDATVRALYGVSVSSPGRVSASTR